MARKHCGQQDEWAIALDLLRKKCGSGSSDKEFRRLVGDICEENARHNHMPDYTVTLEESVVRFTNRKTLKALPVPDKTVFYQLDPETFHDAKTVAPGYDVYYLEQEWREFWVDSGKPELKNPDAAFIGFCKSRHKKHPMQ
ncbi:MAG: replication initiator protein A [Methylocella sp.]